MNTQKIKEVIAEMEAERATLGEAIARLREVLAMLTAPRLETVPASAAAGVKTGSSYIADGVSILRAAGKPLHVLKIVEEIRKLHANQHILRGSVESSFLRHIKTQRENAKIAKVGQSTFGLPGWKVEPASSDVVMRNLYQQ